MKYKHIKTGKIYQLLAVAVDVSDSNQKGRIVVVYCQDGDENTIYTRDRDEFNAKFDPYTSTETTD